MVYLKLLQLSNRWSIKITRHTNFTLLMNDGFSELERQRLCPIEAEFLQAELCINNLASVDAFCDWQLSEPWEPPEVVPSCVDETEQEIYEVVQFVPLVSTLWDLVSEGRKTSWYFFQIS